MRTKSAIGRQNTQECCAIKCLRMRVQTFAVSPFGKRGYALRPGPIPTIAILALRALSYTTIVSMKSMLIIDASPRTARLIAEIPTRRRQMMRRAASTIQMLVLLTSIAAAQPLQPPNLRVASTAHALPTPAIEIYVPQGMPVQIEVDRKSVV